jgi:excisionase family DNA binding protein
MEAPEFVVTPDETTPDEKASIRDAEAQLGAYLEVVEGGQPRRVRPPRLVFEDGCQLDLSPDVLRTLKFVLHHVARGDMIGLIPMNKLLSTNQAAEILNVSRPFLVKLLGEDAIPYTKVGTHHRLRMRDVLEYKQRRDRRMLEGLDELAREAQEAGNYFDD